MSAATAKKSIDRQSQRPYFPPYKRVALDSLIPYARNSRTHSADQVAQIAASIKEFGFTNPILIDAGGGIIAGHGRVLAARKLGMDEVPVIELGHLTETQRRAYVIADNKLALNAGWDDAMLKLELGDLRDTCGFDFEVLGFAGDELQSLMTEPSFEPGTEEDQGRLDQKTPIVCPKCAHEFQA